jgi:predicted MFS family arabinose efflux permease
MDPGSLGVVDPAAESGALGRTSVVRELLARRDFRRMLFGQSVSALGDWLGTIAVMMAVLRLSGSATAVGGVLVLQLLPAAIAAPLVSRLVARVDRRQVLLASDAIRAVLAVLLPVVAAVGWIYVWAFLLQLASLAFLPARDAAIPRLAGLGPGPHSRQEESRLSAANAVMLGTYYGSIPIGAGLFAAITTVGDALAVPAALQLLVAFWLDALTFLVSFLAVRGIEHLGHRRPAMPGIAADGGQRPAPTPPRLRVLWRYPAVRYVEQATFGAAVGIGALFSLGTVFVTSTMELGTLGFGALVALFGVGAATGLGAQRLVGDRARPPLIRSALAVQGGVIVSMTAVASPLLAMLGAVAFGSAVTLALLNALSLLQDSLAGALRDLALSAFHLTLRAGLALSAVLAGAVADVLRPTRMPLLGTLQPAQTVLLAAGSLCMLAAFAMPRRLATPRGGG